MLIRRNTEGTNEFADSIDNELSIYDMQGLLIGSNGNFTAAIEAFELPNGERCNSLEEKAFGSEEALYIRARFAEQVGVPFYVLLHHEGSSNISIYEFCADHDTHKCERRQLFSLREPAFIEWWHERKQTVQTKPYRMAFQDRVERSYFDNLLEANDLKWGGNVDGYFVSAADDNYLVEGIIEKRFTTKKSIYRYDPADYFHFGGGDYYTWKALFTLKNILNVPLYLFTFSQRENEENLVGATIVTNLTREGISYINDGQNDQIKPSNSICNNETELRNKIAYLSDLYYI